MRVVLLFLALVVAVAQAQFQCPSCRGAGACGNLQTGGISMSGSSVLYTLNTPTPGESYSQATAVLCPPTTTNASSVTVDFNVTQSVYNNANFPILWLRDAGYTVDLCVCNPQISNRTKNECVNGLLTIQYNYWDDTGLQRPNITCGPLPTQPK